MKKQIKTLIIQAGGRGMRMKHLTNNRPKVLIDFNGKTILQRYIDQFKDCQIIIIGDYKFDVLKTYTRQMFPDKDISFVRSTNKSTYSGLNDAKSLIKHNEPIGIIWSDLILDTKIQHEGDVQIFTSKVECRYCYNSRKDTIEKKSNVSNGKIASNGIIGLFTLRDKSLIKDNEYGSFVGEFLPSLDKSLLSGKIIKNVVDIGTLERYNEQINKQHSRYFNLVKKVDNTIVKSCIVHGFDSLLKNEINWYQHCSKLDFNGIPKLHATKPLTIDYIDGKHPYDMEDFSIGHFEKIIETIQELHNLEPSKKVVKDDVMETYVIKTINRVMSVKSLLYGFNSPSITINNRKYFNPFFDKNINGKIPLNDFKATLFNLRSEVSEFRLIHGDTTNSNMILSNDKVYLIDPRGVFGKTKLYGDPDYDWAKLYYSFFGEYDFINRKEAWLQLNNDNQNYSAFLYAFNKFPIEMENLFYQKTGISKEKNLLLQSSIWFSLTGYVIEDLDAMNIAFLKGIIYYNEFLNLQKND